MLLAIEHRLRFDYSAFVRESHMEIRVEPRVLPHQSVHDFDLAIGPHAQPSRHEDWLGNALHWFSITDYRDRVEVACRSLVETSPPPIDPMCLEGVVGDGAGDRSLWDFLQFGGPVLRSDRLVTLSEELNLASCHSIGEMIAKFADSLRSHIEYRPNVTHAHSTSDDALKAGAGVCQDLAHISLGLLRLHGVPCRYVSGYLHVENPSKPSESHAWIEFWSAEHGWVPFDPTHGSSVGEQHVVVGYGRQYDDVPPNRGIFRGAAEESLAVEVHTKRVERRERHHASTPLVMDVPVFPEAPDVLAVHEQRGDEAAAQQQQQQ